MATLNSSYKDTKEVYKYDENKEINLWWMKNESIKSKQFELWNFKKNAVRGIIIDSNNNVAIIYSSKENYYKVPGWWVEVWENIEIALRREIQEEAWVNIEIISYIWNISEQDWDWNIIQKNIWYLCKLKWDKTPPKFTEEEIERWFELRRIKIDEAISLMENNKTGNYRWYFMQSRDLQFLKESKKYFIYFS